MREGYPSERRIYVTVSIVTWLLACFYHLPVPGFAFVSPAWLQLVGICGVLMGLLMFFEGATFDFIRAFIGAAVSTAST